MGHFRRTTGAVLFLTATFAGAGEPVPYPQSIPVPAGSPKPVYQPFRATCRDGTKLFVHEWAPPAAPARAPVVVFIHGIGLHGAPYAAVAPGFTLRGVAFVAPDLRGHGRSEGERGALAPPQLMREDISTVLNVTRRRHPGAPVFLVGESMGGLLAADYAAHEGKSLTGLVLLAPAFRVPLGRRPPAAGARRMPERRRPVLEGLRLLPEAVRILRSGRVSLDDDDKLGASTREPGMARAKRSDLLALHEVSVDYLLTLAGMQSDWPDAAARLRLPLCFVVGAKDAITDNAATERVLAKAGTPERDRAWRKWDDAFHSLCWDPVTPRCIDEVARWVLARGTR
jgi:alpha-beta hydrolase superfamily lysophospholipase